MKPAVKIGDVAYTAVDIVQRRVPPMVIHLLTLGNQSVTAHVNVPAGVQVRTRRPVHHRGPRRARKREQGGDGKNC